MSRPNFGNMPPSATIRRIPAEVWSECWKEFRMPVPDWHHLKETAVTASNLTQTCKYFCGLARPFLFSRLFFLFDYNGDHKKEKLTSRVRFLALPENEYLRKLVKTFVFVMEGTNYSEGYPMDYTKKR